MNMGENARKNFAFRMLFTAMKISPPIPKPTMIALFKEGKLPGDQVDDPDDTFGSVFLLLIGHRRVRHCSYLKNISLIVKYLINFGNQILNGLALRAELYEQSALFAG